MPSLILYPDFSNYKSLPSIFLCSIFLYGCAGTSSLQQFQTNPPEPIEENTRITDFSFNGYTTHWQDQYNKQIRYSNLIRFDVPDITRSILQSKVNIAEDLGIPGLKLQEGFINSLLQHSSETMEDPSLTELKGTLTGHHVLVYVDQDSDAGQKLKEISEKAIMHMTIPAHQYDAQELSIVKAYMLENGNRKLWVISTPDEEARNSMKSLIRNVRQVVDRYDFEKGWFGVQTLLKSVTATPGHPIEVIGKGLNEGCTWFVFDGYMEFLAKDEIAEWVKLAGLPVVSDVGFSPVYGCGDYEGLQVQTMFSPELWLEFAQDNSCHIFRPVYNNRADSLDLPYDGYRASIGNKVQIDNEDMPFVLPTGNLLSGTIPSMVLFTPKGNTFTRESMWEAILDRRAVGIGEKGQMMGPDMLRKALGLLTLDRVFLEKYFSDEILLETEVKGYSLNVNIRNATTESVAGQLTLSLPPGLKHSTSSPNRIQILPGQEKHVQISLQPELNSMAHSNPIGISFQWPGGSKTTAALLDLPPVITAVPVAYGQTTGMIYPVTIHNYSTSNSYPVKVEVFHKDNPDKPIWTTTKTGTSTTGTFQTLEFDIKLEADDYVIRTTALDAHLETQLGIRQDEGKPTLRKTDLNQDGTDEYILENDSVRVTLLTTGARVIDYTVKSKQDNLLFKLWPEKPADDRRPFRNHGFYPFGGFEDFLGQPSIETHIVYDAEVLTSSEHQVSVRMKTEYFGGKIEKTFTLYGDSPLLEIRFGVTMNRPELNMIGPQPILELGQAHGPEDVFVIPERAGNKEYRMKPERYYGRIAYLREGWNAGWDSRDNVSFTGAYPVDLPLFLHMWMNHPSNNDANYYYAEFQPWIPIPPHSTLHFSYFMWGNGGSWQIGVKALRERNLIEPTHKKEP